MLIEQVMKRTLRADFVVDYRPEGLVCRMVLPCAAVEAISEARRETSAKRADVRSGSTPTAIDEHQASGARSQGRASTNSGFRLTCTSRDHCSSDRDLL